MGPVRIPETGDPSFLTIGKAVAFAIVFMFLVLFGSLYFADAAGQKPVVVKSVMTVATRAPGYGPEQVKMFESGEAGIVQMQKDINKWLKDHEDKVEITRQPTQSGAHFVTVITIWYRNKTD